MDQKCNVKVKRRRRLDDKRGRSFARLVSGFVKEFLIRRVSIITFRYDHCFYVGFTYY